MEILKQADIKHLDLMHSLAGRKDEWLVCEKCGIKDITKPGYVGTHKDMKCSDCAGKDGFASRCRNCCETEHATKFADLSLDELILKLSTNLRNKGLVRQADDLEKKFISYKVAANTHIYRAHDEDGEDVINAAHPDGDAKTNDGEFGDVETILSKHKKIVDVIQKQPTGKLGSYVDACKIVLGQNVSKEVLNNNITANLNMINDSLSKLENITSSELTFSIKPFTNQIRKYMQSQKIDDLEDVQHMILNLRKRLDPSGLLHYETLGLSGLSTDTWTEVQGLLEKITTAISNAIDLRTKLQNAKSDELAEGVSPENKVQVKNVNPPVSKIVQKANELINKLKAYNSVAAVANNTQAKNWITTQIKELQSLISRYNSVPEDQENIVEVSLEQELAKKEESVNSLASWVEKQNK
jgi:hypothetical protein